jgi:hypothetical protein
MRSRCYLLLALAPLAFAAAPAMARVCVAGKLICATTMPVGGFCECSAHGESKDGTVFEKAPPGAKINATAGGCGAHPNAPGCR